MANSDFNLCTNWGLRCFEQKITEKAVILKCTMSRKLQDGGYSAPVYIDVVCNPENCEMEKGDYAKLLVDVDGQFSVSEYTNKDGNKIPTMTIFAVRVTKKSR